MLWVPCNTRSQRDSQHGEVTPRTNISRTLCCFTTPPVDHEVRGVYWLPGNQSRVKPTQLRVGYLCFSDSPQNPFAHPWVKHLDDGVPASISLLMGSSRDHTPKKTFQCAFMHIHLFRGSLLKIKQFPNIYREPLIQFPPNGMRDSALHQG
jgi:hypothetical protein